MQLSMPSASDSRWLVLTFAISTAASFALLLLFCWHCYLILTAQVLSPSMLLPPLKTGTSAKEGCTAVFPRQIDSGVWYRLLWTSSTIGPLLAT